MGGERISKFLEDNNLLNEEQGGFRKGHSTVSTVSEFTDDVLAAISQNRTTIATFVDLTKAFDTVNHQILLNKTEHLGLHLETVVWLRDYLRNCKHCTRANGLLSEYQEIKCGVPQGAILGPLLFLIYINDIDKVNNSCHSKLYADDTVLYIAHTNPITAYNQVQSDLIRLAAWCDKNQLTINVKKSKSMIFGTSNMLRRTQLPKLTLNDEETDFVKVFNYLGVKLDDQINYEHFIKETAKLIAHKMYLFSEIRKYINKKQAITIYKTKILQYFDYCDILYIGTHQHNLTKLHKLQNMGLRMCIKAEPQLAIARLHNKAGVNCLEQRRKSHLLIFAYNRKQNPKYTKTAPRQTRLFKAAVLECTLAKGRVADRSVYNKCAVAWNALSVEKRNIPTLERFKKDQKRHLMYMWT